MEEQGSSEKDGSELFLWVVKCDLSSKMEFQQSPGGEGGKLVVTRGTFHIITEHCSQETIIGPSVRAKYFEKYEGV